MIEDRIGVFFLFYNFQRMTDFDTLQFVSRERKREKST